MREQGRLPGRTVSISDPVSLYVSVSVYMWFICLCLFFCVNVYLLLCVCPHMCHSYCIYVCVRTSLGQTLLGQTLQRAICRPARLITERRTGRTSPQPPPLPPTKSTQVRTAPLQSRYSVFKRRPNSCSIPEPCSPCVEQAVL